LISDGEKARLWPNRFALPSGVESFRFEALPGFRAPAQPVFESPEETTTVHDLDSATA